MISRISFRPFQYTEDWQQIEEICRNVYNGHDGLVRRLANYAEDPMAHPHVLVDGSQVVAFCNLQFLSSYLDTEQIVYFDGCRVLESRRSSGLATMIMTALKDYAISVAKSGKPLCFLSTSIPPNVAMCKVFKRLGMNASSELHLWPSFVDLDHIRTVRNGRMVDILGVTQLIPKSASPAFSNWKRISDGSEIRKALMDLQQIGCSGLLPLFFQIESPSEAADFLEESGSGRAVWKLEKNGTARALLFVQRHTYSEPIYPNEGFLSACVADLEDLDNCIGFAAHLDSFDMFQIAIDCATGMNDKDSSSIISKAATSPYIIYKHAMSA